MDFKQLQKWTLKYLINDIDYNINQYRIKMVVTELGIGLFGWFLIIIRIKNKLRTILQLHHEHQNFNITQY